ncbi:ABC transporter permease subunit [Microbacterium laevaniformans]|jgi:putative spermidine/putrescine transport system permease protein|uniref:Thiamine transporter membrane protein n=1 Tax=Microbacterium laevaniformans TaxID=36807 RepID=A0A150HF73_9MICO|nr:ABC transporter permease subunit [Microbacterium laevaniformans]EIC08449.1 ABC-type transporter, integral membrane subunit [Microbacterium laevaniformans OR221]KXZ60777.1 thiamine transporter membrane protein [Microbacterium laevaniformans]MBM7753444.1 putative spermidine/putrescine transport system permease protein [Microbacterium laevaniformans]GLJ65562.1 ABC transporter permease [Microbacterium laevaniformans]
MNRLTPSPLTRAIVGIVVGAFFAIPLVSTLIYTLRMPDGSLSWSRWAGLFDPHTVAALKPLWTGLGNSLVLCVVTVAIVLLLLAPTMVLVALRFARLRRAFEFAVLLPISIPAIVLVVGLAPIYQQIGRLFGTGVWTLAFAYGITVLPFAYRAIQASIDAVDLRTLAEAARSLGAGWTAVIVRVLAPNLRQGLLAASLISIAVVLGEFTIASLLNRQVFQTAMVVVQKQDPYTPAIFTLLALVLAFTLLLLIGRAARGTRKARP